MVCEWDDLVEEIIDDGERGDCFCVYKGIKFNGFMKKLVLDRIRGSWLAYLERKWSRNSYRYGLVG